MFPPDQLTVMLGMTSEFLRTNIYKLTTKGDIVKWMGILILVTRKRYRGFRRKLWDTVSKYTLFTSCNFNKTVTSRYLFEQLCSCVWYSNQYVHHHECMSHAKHHWKFAKNLSLKKSTNSWTNFQ